jgi:arylesterase/paraoxonase
MIGRVFGLVFLVALIAAGVWVYFFLQAAGVFTTIAAKTPGACTAVTGGEIVGVEDLTIDPVTKIAFLSGYDRRIVTPGAAARGAIWTYDLAERSDPVDATVTALPGGFSPHGISLWRGADGRKALFAISHAGGRHTVEVFDVNGAALTHRRTIEGPELVSPNDIVGVGPDAFYVSNDHANVAGWRRTAEDYLRLKETKVYYFDGQGFTQVLDRIGGANGVNVSADGKSLYLSAASERTVYVFDRDLQTNALTQRAAVPVPGFADNIEVLANGDLLLGLHSKILQLISHFSDPSKRSPSHVMHLKQDGKGGFTAETIYYNDGAEISGVSVGAGVDRRLLIGAIIEPKILDCAWETAP